MFEQHFSFRSKKEENQLFVSASDLFHPEVGYGFVPYLSPDHVTMDRFRDYGGWLPRKDLNTAMKAPQFRNREYGVELHQKDWPLCFRAAVPKQGVYSVTITIHGGEQGLSGLNIYTNRRNLVHRDVKIGAGEVFTYHFFLHICDYIPIVGQDPSCDSSVYITVLGDVARLSSVSIKTAKAPTIFLGGDSIVADYEAYYPYNPIINFGSWGQNLLQYFNQMAISDQAHGGMTTNCFRDDGHWDIISKRLCPGDVFMFQFGHNDQKRRYLSAHSGYAANLRWYIHQVRRKGAIPIMVTSLSRIPNKDEHGYYDLLEEHAEACRKVGREWQVAVIDLHQLSFHALCRMDQEQLKGYFNDAAHTNDYGALYMADLIATEIRRQQIQPLCDNMNDYAPLAWKPNESLRPVTLVSPTDKAEAPVLPTDLPELPYVDCIGIPQYLGLKEAMAKGLLDPCLKFFHPFDEIPRGQFLYMFFKAAKAPDKRPYQGKYCDIYKYEWDAFNVQAAIDAELIDETTTMNERFRPDEGLTCGELISFIIRNLHKIGERNYTMIECEEEANRLGLLWSGYERHNKVNRADCTLALVAMLNVQEK